MKYDAILYDMDGTVLDTVSDLCDSMNYALSRFSLPPISDAQAMQYLGSGAKRYAELACPEGSDAELIEQVLQVYKPWYKAHCRIRTAPYAGIPELMQTLKACGAKQAIISNKPDSAVQALVPEFFDGLLELAVGESAEVRRKPAPDSVLRAAGEMGVAVEKCVYIGDTEVDIETARRAGMDCVCVAWGFRSVEQLRSAGAPRIVRSVEELKAVLLA